MNESPMTMNPEYLKYCSYYKGEETIPWEKDFARFTRFWILERDYYSSFENIDHEYWETKGQEMFDNPTLKKFLSEIENKTIKGFVTWAATTSYDHNPAGGYLFVLNYKYKTRDKSIDNPNTENYNNDIETKEKYCLYYKGEEECPYDLRSIQSTFWRIEKIWDIIVRDDEIERSNKEGEFLYDFPDAIDSIKNVPVSLKATLYSQYCHFGGDRYGFEDYLKNYISNAPRK